MIAIDFPFRFNEGSLSVTDNYRRVVRALLIDALMTNNRERIMRPDYGADIQSFVFTNMEELRLADTAELIKRRVEAVIARGDLPSRIVIESVTIEKSPTRASTVVISVIYRPNSYDDPEALEFEVPEAA